MMGFYRWLLKLYPARFREEYGRELLAAFREERAEAASGWVFWTRLFWDLFRSVPLRLAEECRADLRVSLRNHLRRPLVAVATILTLAIGIGASTGLFSVVDALAWKALPYRNPESLVALHHYPGTGSLSDSPSALRAWLHASAYLQDAGLHSSDELNVSGGAEAVRVRVCESSANLFSLFGVDAQWGRTFLAEEDVPGNNSVAVISHELWQQLFGGDPSVLGRTLRISGVPFRIVGVAPPRFRFPDRAQVWTPTVFDFARIPKEGVIFWTLEGRLKDGVTLAAARQAFAAEVERLAPGRRWPDEVNRPALLPMRQQLAGQALRGTQVLFSAVLCMLLIACANVANLLGARALDRRRELQLRAALGASGARLFQQLCVEALALSLLAGVLSLGVAWLIPPLCSSLLPQTGTLDFDGRALFFAFALSVLSGLLFGVWPAWHASRLETAGGPARDTWQLPLRRGRHLALGAQLALTVVLLSTALALLRSYAGLWSTDTGYRTAGILTLRVSLTGTDPGSRPAEERLAFYRQAVARLRALPGVDSAAAVSLLPLARDPIGMTSWQVEGGGTTPSAMSVRITPGYFETLGIHLAAGRDFSPADQAGSEKVIIVSEEVARQFGGPQQALGHRLLVKARPGPRTIVGVARSIRHFGPADQGLAQIYEPLDQTGWPNLTFLLKTRLKPTSLSAAARAAIRDIDRGVPVYAMQSFDSYLEERLAQPRIYTLMVGLFGGFAALLCGLGLYSLVRYTVSRRLPEFGLRMALGAGPGRLYALVLAGHAPVVAAALAAGVLLTWLSRRLIHHLMQQVENVAWSDVAWISTALVILFTLTVIGAARLIGRLEPARVLRSE